jgi:hypothetical protein
VREGILTHKLTVNYCGGFVKQFKLCEEKISKKIYYFAQEMSKNIFSLTVFSFPDMLAF